MTETAELVVRDNPVELRYELRLGDTIVGEIRYRSEPGRHPKNADLVGRDPATPE